MGLLQKLQIDASIKKFFLGSKTFFSISAHAGYTVKDDGVTIFDF